MFPIIKAQLTDMGFEVKAEVDHIDIMAIKDDKTLIVEMKQSLSLRLIYQGIERQKISDYVYLAILKPSETTLNSRTFKEKKTIVKTLGLGLIIVDTNIKQVTFLLDPIKPRQYQDTRKKKKAHQEFLLRKTAMNQGGISQTKIITVYREKALKILDYLKDGEQPLKAIVKYTDDLKTTRILIDNHYGWFKRVSRGIYTLSEEGKEALITYQDVIEALKDEA